MGTIERRERERGEMRGLILETAMRLFLEEGYDKVSMRRIADEIEYSPGTIYLYFQEKDEIVYALHTMAFEKFYQALSVMGGTGNPFERLQAGGLAYVDFALSNPELYELMFIMRAPARMFEKEDGWAQGERSYQLLHDTVRECAQAGFLPADTDLDAATLYVWATVHGLVSLAVRCRLDMFPKDQITGLVHRALAVMVAQMEA